MLDVRPDLVTLGKVVAGGTPAAVFGGRHDVMSLFDPSEGRILQSGTFNGNPVSLTAGMLTLQRLTPAVYEEIGARTNRLSRSLQGVFGDAGLPASICTIGSLFRIYFLEKMPRNYREAAADDRAMHRWLFLSLLNRGIYWRNAGTNALSVPMTDEHIDHLTETVRDILSEAR